MIAICHFLALAKSSLFLVKLGSTSLFIWANILNIDIFFKYIKKDGLDEGPSFISFLRNYFPFLLFNLDWYSSICCS